jgi:hypothetical protein
MAALLRDLRFAIRGLVRAGRWWRAASSPLPMTPGLPPWRWSTRRECAGVSPRDPLTFLAIAAILTVVALVASGVPAWRAARVDPMTTLRAE